MHLKADQSPSSITSCEHSDSSNWNAYVGNHPAGTFYHLHEWTKVNEAALGHSCHYLMAGTAENIQGVLPLTFVSSRLFGRILCSMPFVNYGGPCASNAETYKSLLEAARKKAEGLNATYLELRCANSIDTDLPVSLRKVSLTLNLQPDPDAVWNAFSTKHRTAIRRSYKNELEVRSGGADLLPQFYQMMQQSWKALGTPLYSRSYFEQIVSTFGDKTKIFVCYRKDEPIAVAFNGYFNNTVEGMWAGGSPLARSLQANYVLYWEMIKDGCLRGCTKFHLGRSTADSGSEDFKKKWNASAQQLHWYYYRPDGEAMPQLNVDNPKFQLAIRAWQKIPMWTTNILGPTLARLIP